MDEQSKALGVGNSFTIDGVDYEVTPFSWKMHALYTRWLKNKAWSEVEQDRGTLDPMTYKERHDAVTALILGGYFNPGGAGFTQAEQTLEGIIYKTFLMLQAKNPKVTLAQVEGWFETKYATDIANRIAEMEAADKAEGPFRKKPAETAVTSTPTASSPSAPSSWANPGT